MIVGHGFGVALLAGELGSAVQCNRLQSIFVGFDANDYYWHHSVCLMLHYRCMYVHYSMLGPTHTSLS